MSPRRGGHQYTMYYLKCLVSYKKLKGKQRNKSKPYSKKKKKQATEISYENRFVRLQISHYTDIHRMTGKQD